MTGDPAERWIVIPRWDGDEGFQHYKDRDPIWVKNYCRLVHDDAYRGLSFVQRGILHGLWLEYAASNRQLRDSTLTLTRRLGQRVTRASLEALNHAGFITFSASKPLAPRYPSRASREEETDTEEEKKDLLTTTEMVLPLTKLDQKERQNGFEPIQKLIEQSLAQTTTEANQP